MTIGIYSLYWEEQDLIYIGQSQNIENRFKEHLNLLNKNKHTNYKIQNAFDTYGLPTLIIVEECSISLLNNLEIYWQKEFNSLNSLDLIEAGQVGFGINSNSSKYTKLQILLVFRLLTRKLSFNYTNIAKIVNVNISLVKDVSNCISHLWLRDKYPKLYSKMISLDRITKGNSLLNVYKELPKVVSPDGNIFVVDNIRLFAKENNIDNTHLGEVIRGNRHSHKGWKLFTATN